MKEKKRERGKKGRNEGTKERGREGKRKGKKGKKEGEQEWEEREGGREEEEKKRKQSRHIFISLSCTITHHFLQSFHQMFVTQYQIKTPRHFPSMICPLACPFREKKGVTSYHACAEGKSIFSRIKKKKKGSLSSVCDDHVNICGVSISNSRANIQKACGVTVIKNSE